MLRLTHYLNSLFSPISSRQTSVVRGKPTGSPVVIWNLIRQCNLTCRHCYSTSANKSFTGELSTDEACTVMDDLYAYGVRVLILSGGEPLMRPDIMLLARRAKNMGFYVGLSSNGTLLNPQHVQQLVDMGVDYVGISLDGIGATHDAFRRLSGAFNLSMQGVRLARDAGLRVGIRYTMTEDNAHDLPSLLQLLDDEHIDKFYFSHLNYAGRGNRHRGDDARHRRTRQAMELLMETCLSYIMTGHPKEFVTGNNDADGVYLLQWVAKHYPQYTDKLHQQLQHWGGNASGVNIANIDNLGNVHPDTMWWKIRLGNVREQSFSSIWQDNSHPLMEGLRQSPRPVTGRCANCQHLSICNGNTRVRAWELTGDFWASDPACYLTDAEIGVAGGKDKQSIRTL